MLTSSYPRHAADTAAPFVRSLAEALARQGLTVSVVAPADPAARPLPGPVRCDRFAYAPFPAWAIMGHARALHRDQQLDPRAYVLIPLYLTAALRALLRLHRSQPLDLIHAHWVLPNGPAAALAARITGRPLVISLHGSDVFVAGWNPLFRALAGWCCRQARTVIACSPELADRARRLGAPKERLTVIPHGVDPERFHPVSPDERARLRAALGLEPTALFVIAIGRLVPKKGFHHLVAALPLVAATLPTVRLLILGEGPERSALVRLAARLGVDDRLLLRGAVPWPEVPRYLQAADVLAMPSVHDAAGNVDGLPTVVLEALACGLPVVASRVSGLPLVVHDGENGRLVPEGEAPALARALVEVLADPDRRRQLGATARRLVLERWTWDHIAQEYRAVYQAALSARAGMF